MTPTDLRDLLITWADINSGSDNIAGLEQMRAVLAHEFATLPGAGIEHVALDGSPARVLRIAVRPHAPVQLLLSGHYDTVYGAAHPFQRCTLVDENTLRGPGVADMKGGLVVMLAALRALECSAGAARIGYEILLTPDEEIGSAASRPALERAARSGRFAFALVFEPARDNGNLVHSRKGTGIFTLTCHGRAAHAGRDPAAGRNAILALSALLPPIDALNRELPGIMLNIGTMHGGTSANTVPDRAEARINIRTTTLADEARVLGRLRERIAPLHARDGFRVVLDGRFNRPPKECAPPEEKLFAEWQQCGRELGIAFSWEHVSGGSDGNLLSAAGLPNLDGLGPVGHHTHSADEFVLVSSLAERANVAARFLIKLADGMPAPATTS